MGSRNEEKIAIDVHSGAQIKDEDMSKTKVRVVAAIGLTTLPLVGPGHNGASGTVPPLVPAAPESDTRSLHLSPEQRRKIAQEALADVYFAPAPDYYLAIRA